MNFSNWATMPVSLTANVVQGINLPMAANLIMVRNPDTTNEIYISATANISSTIRDSVANVGNYGFLVRPMPLRTFYLLSAGDISGVEVFFITVDKPLDFLHLMAQPPTQLAAITSSALPNGASTEATQLLVKAAALAIQAAVEGTLDVQLSGSSIANTQALPVTSIKKRIISTVINAQSLAASALTGYVSCGLDGTESEVWVAVSIDKQPWSLYAGTVFNVNTGYTSTVYPKYASKAATYTALVPALALLMNMCPLDQGLTDPTSVEEARNIMFPMDTNMRINIENKHATDIATVTVKVIRIWR